MYIFQIPTVGKDDEIEVQNVELHFFAFRRSDQLDRKKKVRSLN